MLTTSKQIAVMMTSDIQDTIGQDGGVPITTHNGLDYYSSGVLEKLIKFGYQVMVVSTRDELSASDEWWVKLVGRENIFLTPPNSPRHLGVDNPALLAPWRELFARFKLTFPPQTRWWDALVMEIYEGYHPPLMHCRKLVHRD
jgi:hypothetical protein